MLWLWALGTEKPALLRSGIAPCALDKNMFVLHCKLTTRFTDTYGKVLEFKGELTGIAEVMTDERSVTGRLFGPLRYLWEKYLS